MGSKLEKGGLILVSGIWHVIVAIRLNKDKKLSIDCICDHANNIYSWEAKDIDLSLTLKEIAKLAYNQPNEKVSEAVRKRDIPYDVIVEVISGREDCRFDHWYEDEEV